jgi:thiosulfate reductase cytochrome b subunit
LKRIVEKHPLAIRWLHWISFPLLAFMVWSGLMIYWANDAYRIGWGNTTLFHFFPDSFYDALNLSQRLAEAMGLHFFFMWFFAVNGLVYVIYLAISGEWRHIVPDRRTWRDAILVTLYELHIIKTAPPQGKYNGAQRIAYTGVIVMAAGSIITGAAIYKPIQAGWLASLLGGYPWARAEHFWLMIGFVLFFAVHVFQVIKSGWNNFRSMVAGHELVDAEEPSHE